jgi:hypothetical protein
MRRAFSLEAGLAVSCERRHPLRRAARAGHDCRTDRPAHATTVTAIACLEAHGHRNIRATCCNTPACAASFPVERYPSVSSSAPANGLQPQPSEPHAQGFWLNTRSAKARLQASNFQAQGCRARQAKPRNANRKPFCCTRDAPGNVRKPLNAAREAQRREMARFGTATARFKTSHAMPATFGRRAITVARNALSCALRSFWLARKGSNRCRRILGRGPSVSPHGCLQYGGRARERSRGVIWRNANKAASSR